MRIDRPGTKLGNGALLHYSAYIVEQQRLQKANGGLKKWPRG